MFKIERKKKLFDIYFSGMRFSLLETRIAFARILRHYTLVQCEKTASELKTAVNSIYCPSDGVWVKAVKRT